MKKLILVTVLLLSAPAFSATSIMDRYKWRCWPETYCIIP